mgnify:CR=1 FL=1
MMAGYTRAYAKPTAQGCAASGCLLDPTFSVEHHTHAPVAAEHPLHVLYAVQAALHLPAAAFPAAAICLRVQPVMQRVGARQQPAQQHTQHKAATMSGYVCYCRTWGGSPDSVCIAMTTARQPALRCARHRLVQLLTPTATHQQQQNRV